ncbi:Clan CD, family C13, asparaginyl endopeptidase-like cysteine peptidase [Trichomonas vaginalis G3]|uniref:Clan CD, family C13, asparaginyl endopeptidase-like cysteine peptidase n=1 Tax=Trichomonas vaginalis (strain ATCC PRA-98 / G3) TaxID=412133 RepID=A2EJG6_TRIV3|nr:cysteine-type peptidase protein [Trichomonas vaginalis G3]EAY07223.1 Clan CD, family C13, asparaginyl endopeptidase-like cysteine peptidase [Trichomonas vaginalis G3]KAI5533911.1 cysteine-type peptidase protein [Trichomonas vaginalis G3]|eukprot:XP_001319446.1 Clan CD, family C13, asparaginyl endopeptidase-like cysteine peptidase [Trichomonas vaginalis G3]
MLAAFLAQLVSAENWAVIMAGSKTYKNYRHQADAFQMYQILRSRGFKKDHIILMAYDDIVDCDENPYPGYVYNIKKYVSVYPGRKNIDYRGENVTAWNFYNVLTGKKVPGLPVLRSTEEDNVFVYYNDHGFKGYLCAPAGGHHINGWEIKEVVDLMEQKGMFGKLFIAIEACYSGSVSKLFKGRDNIAVLSAANSIQSSYSHGYDYEIETFRTNEWTNHLLHFILTHPESTIGGLVNYTRIHTYGSDTRYYGDKDMLETPLSEFLLEAEPMDINYENAEIATPIKSRVDQMKTEETFLKKRMETAKDSITAAKYAKKLHDEIARHKKAKQTILDIVHKLGGHNSKPSDDIKIKDWECYGRAVDKAIKQCKFEEAEYTKLGNFAEICNHNTKEEVAKVIDEMCPIH